MLVRCGHCQELAPKYRKAAALLDDTDLPRKVVLAKYDDSTDSQRQLRAGAEDVFNYKAYPSLFIFDHGKHQRYGGGRESKDIVAFMSAYAKGLDPYEVIEAPYTTALQCCHHPHVAK